LKLWQRCTVFRFELCESRVLLRSNSRDSWIGMRSDIKEPPLWLSANMKFVLNCVNKIETDLTSNEASRFAAPNTDHIVEFVKIYAKPLTFLCLIMKGSRLDDYLGKAKE